jgi:hypothetical protein
MSCFHITRSTIIRFINVHLIIDLNVSVQEVCERSSARLTNDEPCLGSRVAR